jgi:hypothetical protein
MSASRPSPSTIAPAPDFFAGLGGFGAHFLDLAELRARVARWLESHAGLRSSGATEGAYEALILPDDDPAWRHRYADEAWSCALRYRAALRYLGVNHALVTCPYATRIGRAVSDLSVVARHYDALVTGKALEAYEPQEADALCSIGGAGPHVSCVTRALWQPGPGIAPVRVLHCADGGQGQKNAMAVDVNVYAWAPGELRSVEAPRSLDHPGPRLPLEWAIDTGKLLLNAGVLGA